jgi:HD-GYP domain-containing protein (c-di-GMP phosphodiesterase class II)
MDVSPALTGSSLDALTRQLEALHERAVEVAPDIQRMACALYDPAEDLLKTFINSTREGTVLRAYQYRLSDSESLSRMARTNEPRLLTDIQNQLQPSTTHSKYILEEGFRSSYTLPLTSNGTFLGFLFFDSRASDTFSRAVRRELNLYGQVIAVSIAHELLAIRSIVSSVMLARDFTTFREAETGAHLQRMARFARLIARRLAAQDEGISDEFVESVFLYAPLHDIGKIAIPDSILLKPGPLDTGEWEVMQSHTVRGREMVETIVENLGVRSLPNQDILIHVVELHHEAMDGSGYPHGLSGEQVPLEARIAAVADVYDALTSRRPYKRAWPGADALAEVGRMADRGVLDAACVGVLREAWEESEQIRARYPDE